MKRLFLSLCLSTVSLFANEASFASQSDLVADLSDALLNGIYHHRLNWHRCPNEKSVWVEGIGNYRNRDSNSQRHHYNDWFGGLIGGLNFSISCDAYFNFFIGGTWGGIDIYEETDFETDSIFFGMSLEKFCSDHFFGFTFAGGVITEDRRFMDVSEKPKGVFFTPELTWAYRCRCVIFETSLRYAGFFSRDYQHRDIASGTLYVQDRSIQLFTLRGELATLCLFNCLEPYIGIAGRFQFDGNRIEGRLVQSHESFSDGIDDNLGYGFVGIRGIKRCGCFDLQVDLEGSYDTDKSGRAVGNITLNYSY